MSVNKVSQDTGELITLSSGVRAWVGTRAAHTIAVANHTMPANCLVCITDDYKNKDDYSTEETDTGKHWINGKPIYRKVIVLAEVKNINLDGTWQELCTSPASIENIIDCRLSRADNHSATYYGNMSWVWSVAISVDTGNVCAYAGNPGNTNYIPVKAIILEYTKTTD